MNQNTNGQADRLFRNYDSLIGGELSELRNACLAIAEAAIRRAIPYSETKKRISVSEGVLRVSDSVYALSELNHIYVIGVGKGAYPIALAMEEQLGELISEGVVLVKRGDHRRLERIEVIESGHPLPDENGIEGAKKIRAIVEKAGADDLILAAITGGSSAMMNLPFDGISLEDLRLTNRLLLGSGADIAHMNMVRKHLCTMKGGHLVELAYPAPMHTFTLDTNPPGILWPDLVYPDSSTYADAIRVAEEYGFWNELPESVKAHLKKGAADPSMETPKVLSHPRNYIHSVADPKSTCAAAAERAKELGFEPYVLSTAMDGEAKDLGIFFACMANEIAETGRPFKAPCALISGGETTVTLPIGCRGKGGPNQETAMGFVTRIREGVPAVCLSMDSDGTDGPTDIAGGISDGFTRKKAAERGVPYENLLKEHESSEALSRMGDALLTGHTGTNIMNVRIVLIGKE